MSTQDPEMLNSLSFRQKKHQRELVATLLESSGNQREYLISVLLSSAHQDSGEEPSLKVIRSVSFTLLSQMIPLLKASNKTTPSTESLLEFCKLLKHMPLDQSNLQNSLSHTLWGVETEHAPEFGELTQRLELLFLLTRLGDFDTARGLFPELEPQVSLEHPESYLIYQISLARSLQRSGKRLQYLSLWLNLTCDFYQLGGSDCAQFIVLTWISILGWSREAEAKKFLLQKFSVATRNRGDLISATLLYELFLLDNKQITPAEKMNYARLLFKHPSSLLTVRQLQFLYFFAGNYSCGTKQSIKESIRFYQHSNYYLHRSWEYLRRLSQFLREHLTPEQFSQTMEHLEQWVIELGSQVSMQNNAYVETLYANYNTIRDLYRQVEDLSITDNLTGLKNRRYLNNNLHQLFQLAARQKVPICFALLDIDLFKQVNDTHGHAAGDLVLQELAKLLSKSFRKSDVIIRFGGDEFLLILFDTPHSRFIRLMDDLLKRLSTHRFKYKDSELSVTVSIGICCEDRPEQTQQYLSTQLEKVDTALYLAKNRGGNQVAKSDC